MKQKIRFKDLSWGLKIPIIAGWIMAVSMAIGGIMGFLEGLFFY